MLPYNMLYLKGKCVMRDFFCFVETLISGMLPFVFLVFSGIYFTVKSNFFQFKYLPSSVAYALGSIFKKR